MSEEIRVVIPASSGWFEFVTSRWNPWEKRYKVRFTDIAHWYASKVGADREFSVYSVFTMDDDAANAFKESRRWYNIDINLDMHFICVDAPLSTGIPEPDIHTVYAEVNGARTYLGPADRRYDLIFNRVNVASYVMEPIPSMRFASPYNTRSRKMHTGMQCRCRRRSPASSH